MLTHSKPGFPEETYSDKHTQPPQEDCGHAPAQTHTEKKRLSSSNLTTQICNGCALTHTHCRQVCCERASHMHLHHETFPLTGSLRDRERKEREREGIQVC